MAQLKCPKCAREFVRRVSRSGYMETLLSYFYIYPFKCQLCGYRFRYCQWGVRYLRVVEDRREYDRMETDIPVSFSSQDISGEGTLLNLSMDGCSLRTATPIEIGTILKLSLQIAEDVPPVIAEAAVVRNVRKSLLGVEFLSWQQSERERLQLYVRGLLIRRGINLGPLAAEPETLLHR